MGEIELKPKIGENQNSYEAQHKVLYKRRTTNCSGIGWYLQKPSILAFYWN